MSLAAVNDAAVRQLMQLMLLLLSLAMLWQLATDRPLTM